MISLFAKASRSFRRQSLVSSSAITACVLQISPFGSSQRSLTSKDSRSVVSRYPSDQETQAATSDALSCKAAIVRGHDPVDVYQNRLNNNNLTRSVAEICFQAVDALNKTDANLGRATIQWLWNEHDGFVSHNDNGLIEVMIKMLMREGHEKTIWDWMGRSSEEDITKLECKVRRYRWRRISLKYLCKAKADLSQHQSLDDALEAFFDAVQRPVDIPIIDAYTFLRDSLISPLPPSKLGDSYGSVSEAHDLRRLRYPNTNLGLWQRFYNTAPAAARRSYVSDQALMMVMHPKRPDPFPMLHLLRTFDEDPNHNIRLIKRSIVRTVWFEKSRHASHLLKEMGHPIEADRVLGVARKLFPICPAGMSQMSGVKSPPRWVTTKSRAHP